MFKKRKNLNVTTISAEYFVKCFKLAKMWMYQADKLKYTVELLAVIFVVVDVAIMNVEKDRYKAASDIRSLAIAIFEKMSEQSISDDELKKELQQYERRIDFYGEVMRGKELRYDFMLGADTSDIVKNPMLRLSAAFTDCLFNPDCIDDYDNAPVMIRDVFDTMSMFQKMTMPIAKELVMLNNTIYRNV